MMYLQDGVSPVDISELMDVLDVWDLSVRATHHFITEADIRYFRPRLLAGLPQMPHLLCVRAIGGKIAGFMGVSDQEVALLFVHPNWIGMGVGSRLMRYAIDELGVTEVAVNEQNAQAVDFYVHLGFRVVTRDEVDRFGKPYPILNMRLWDR